MKGNAGCVPDECRGEVWVDYWPRPAVTMAQVCAAPSSRDCEEGCGRRRGGVAGRVRGLAKGELKAAQRPLAATYEVNGTALTARTGSGEGSGGRPCFNGMRALR